MTDRKPTRPSEIPQNHRYLAYLLSSGGLTLAFAWGLAEGTLFFIIPDLILTLTALFSLRTALYQAFAAVAGALLAGLILFSWANHDYTQAYDTVMAVPFVTEPMATTVRTDIDTHGATALLLGPFSGIPYKLYAIESSSRIELLPFLLATIPARLERLLTGALIVGLIANWQRKRIAKFPRATLALYGICWTVFYVIYWSSV